MIVYTYVKFKEGIDHTQFSEKLESFEDRFLTSADLQETGLSDWKIQLQRITDIHIGSTMKRELEENVQASTINLITGVTLVIILVAVLNYVILMTAVCSRRIKGTAIQLVHGAERRMIILQFIKESFVFMCVCLVIACAFLQVEISLFGNLFYDRVLDMRIFYDTLFILIVGGLIVIIGILGAIYPSVVMSSIRPFSALRGTRQGIGSQSFLTRLSGIQAVTSILMLGFTYAVLKQFSFFHNKEYGFDKDQLLVVFAHPGWKGYEPFRNELMQVPGIENVSQSLNYPGGFVPENLTRIEGKEETLLMASYDGCEDFIETMGFNLVDGSTFEEDDDWKSVILNESAVRDFGWEGDAIGRKIFSIGQRGSEREYTVVGVVRDFHYSSAHEKIEPFMIHMRCSRMTDILVRLNEGDVPEVLSNVRRVWNEVEPNILFDYAFVKDLYAAKYEKDGKLVEVFTIFSVITLLIAIMGFYSISSITAQSRSKEIGIKRTFGASPFDVFASISSRFFIVLTTSAAFSIPISYVAIKEWLSGFAYTIDIEIPLLVGPALSVIAVAMLSFSFQVIAASRISPSKLLRYE